MGIVFNKQGGVGMGATRPVVIPISNYYLYVSGSICRINIEKNKIIFSLEIMELFKRCSLQINI